jgi:hypothetical protein
VQQGRCGSAIEFIPFTVLDDMSVFNGSYLSRTEAPENLSLVIDGYHREAQRLTPKCEIFN